MRRAMGSRVNCNRRQADVAQLVEHFTRNEGVRGSNPRVGFEPIPRARRIGGMSRPLAHLSDEAVVAARCTLGGVGPGRALRPLRACRPTASRCASSGTRRLAEDAVQEAIPRRLARPPPASSRSGAKASTWILTLVHRRAVDVGPPRAAPARRHARDASPSPPSAASTRTRGSVFERERVQEALRLAARHSSVKRSSSRTTAASRQSELAERLGRAARYDQEQDVRRPRAACASCSESPEWTHGHRDLHDLTAAYALDALDADERGGVRGAPRPVRSLSRRSSPSSGRRPPRSRSRTERARAAHTAARRDPRRGRVRALERRPASRGGRGSSASPPLPPRSPPARPSVSACGERAGARRPKR